MNDFEKDEVLEEENEEINEADFSEPEKDELTKELENIRNMMQEELDKAMDSAENEFLIQELDEIEEFSDEDEESEDTEKCECCGENPRSTEYGEDYPYCEECRNLMKKYPLRASGILTAILMVVFLGASLYLSYPYMTDSINTANTSASYNSGYVMTALQDYYAYFNGGKTADAISKRALNECIEGYIKLGYHNDAASLIQSYYNETALSMPWNKKYADIVKKANNLTETYYAVAEVTDAALSGGEYDYDTVMAELDALKEPITAEDGSQITYNRVFIEYYKYIIMSVHEESLETQFEQLKAIDAIGEGYEWVYLSNYCAVAARLGDEEAVNYSFDKLLTINLQDMNAYIAKANYYRYLDAPDADKMIEVCEQAATVATSNDTAYKQSLAIAYLLKGESAQALEEVKALFDAGSYTIQNCNLYAVIGIHTGDHSLYKEMKDLLKGYGYEISEVVTQYKNGKITLEEVLKDEGGDI